MRLRTAAAATAIACTVVLGGGTAAVAADLPNQTASSDWNDKGGKRGGDKHFEYESEFDGAAGFAAGSPGVISGNNIQIPVTIPINLCGNTIDIIGVLNPTFGNVCEIDD